MKHERTVNLYRVAGGILAIAATVLGSELGRTTRERDEARGLLSAQRQEGNPTPAPAGIPGDSVGSAQVVRADLRPVMERFASEGLDAETTEVEIFRSPRGRVVLHGTAFRQIKPLHMHRVTREALLTIAGETQIQYRGRVEKRLAPGRLAYFPPYSAHGWVNPSRSDPGVTLAFISTPEDEASYLAADDDRFVLGAPPAELDVAARVKDVRSAAEPFRLEWPEALGGSIGSLVVTSEARLEPVPDVGVAYVVQGSGELLGGAAAGPLESGHLLYLPAGTALHFKASGDTPLGVILFVPGRRDAGPILGKEKKLYSQYDEELVIRDFFKDRREGVFLDVGAADYKKMSTTYYLEEKLGWSGVAVDALPVYAKGYLEHRPRTRFANYLVTDEAKGVQTFFMANSFTEVSSTDRKVASDQAKRETGDGTVTEVEVASITLNQLLEGAGLKRIDFMNMDIEDHEPAALRGFDIRKYRPALVCIEAHRSVRDEIYAYFVTRGYRRLDEYLSHDTLNWYFTPVSP